jgi:hypothetical protein
LSQSPQAGSQRKLRLGDLRDSAGESCEIFDTQAGSTGSLLRGIGLSLARIDERWPYRCSDFFGRPILSDGFVIAEQTFDTQPLATQLIDRVDRGTSLERARAGLSG